MPIDLKKIISNVIEEGFMEVPKKVLDPIVNYYIEKLKEFKTLGKSKVSKKFGRKEFKLDFSGTRYEKINNHAKHLTIDLSNGDKSWARGDGHIQLDFSDPMRSITEVIEHEILHIIQMALGVEVGTHQKYKDKASKQGIKYPEFHAGLPKKKHITRSQHPNPASRQQNTLYKITKGTPTSYYGNPLDKPRKWSNGKGYSAGTNLITQSGPVEPSIQGWGTKRTQHSSRPIELYTDLLSMIRNLQNSFQNVISRSELENKQEIYNSKEIRKKYLVAFINQQNEIDVENVKLRVFAAPVGEYVWKQFKKILPPKLYQDYLRLMYDAFVNKESPYKYEDVKKTMSEIAQIAADRVQKEIERIENQQYNERDFKFNRLPLAVESPYTYDYLPDMDDIIPNFYEEHPAFSGATIEGAENILWAFKPIDTTVEDMARILITTKLSQILKGFESLGKQCSEDIEKLEKYNSLEDAIKAGSDALPRTFWLRLKFDMEKIYLQALVNQNLAKVLSAKIDNVFYNARVVKAIRGE
jgi:hypothetical protein